MLLLFAGTEDSLLCEFQLEAQVLFGVLLALRLFGLAGFQLLQQLFFKRLELAFLGPILQLLLVVFDLLLGLPRKRLVLVRHLHGRARLSGVEECLEPVEVFLWDRVILVIVAAGATDRNAEEHGGRGAGDLSEPVCPDLRGHKVRPVPWRDAHEGCRDISLDVGEVVIPSLAVLISARDLLDDETVVGHVGVERVDDPVAIPPYVADRAVPLQPARLAVPRQVQPMPAPALSIARICKQLVHEFLERVAGLIPEERVHLLDRRRHTGQINIYATHQNSLVRFRSRSQALLLQLRKDECINRVLHPRAVSYGRRLPFYGLLERPAPLRRL